MPTTRIDAYRTQTIETADPVTLITMLYDGALRAVRRARIHHEAGRRSECFDNTGRAVLILGELRVALDLDRGEVAQGLAALYSYCMRRLSEATWDDIPAAADEVERHIVRVADAWKQIAPQVQAPVTVRASSEAAA